MVVPVRILVVIAASLAVLASAPPGAGAAPPVAEDRIPHQVIVRYDAGTSAATREQARASVGASLGRRLGLPESELLTLPSGTRVREAVTALSANPAVRYAEANAYATSQSACPTKLNDDQQCLPNDPQFKFQYGLDNHGQTISGETGAVADADVDAPEAWNITRGSDDVVVAVVDSGIAYDNPDLAPNLWSNPGEIGKDAQGHDKRSNGIDDDGNGYVDDYRGWDVVGKSVTNPDDSDNDPRDISGHGTHVAGLIGARTNNGIGVSGLDWNVKLMNVRVRAERSNESSADIADAFVYAARNGARIVNVSLSERDYSKYLYDTIKAYPNVLFVVAAGNDALNLDTPGNDRWPCEYDSPNLICVGATDRADNIASFSNRGPNHVDIAAPGALVMSSQPAYKDLSPTRKDTFEADPFAGSAPRWLRGGDDNNWGRSTTHRTGSYALTNKDGDTGNAGPGSDTYVQLAQPLDLSGQMGCELRGVLWEDTDADSGVYAQARADPNFMAASTSPSQDTPTPSNDTIMYVNADRDKSRLRTNISDLDGQSQVYVRYGVLQSATAGSDPQVWLDDFDPMCLSDTYSANGVEETTYLAGTSMATPHVAGVAALMLAKDPTLTVAELREGLLDAIDVLPRLAGKVANGGRINAYKALASSSVAPDGDVLRVIAGDGEINHFSVTKSGASIVVRDPWTALGDSPMGGSRLVPGGGCTSTGDTEVTCPAAGIAKVTVATGNLDDASTTASGITVQDDGRTFSPATATTGATLAVTPTTATLTGVANPGNRPTTAQFEYGTGTPADLFSASQPVGSDADDHAVSIQVTGLTPGATYRYRLVAPNVSGSGTGAFMSFTTPPAPPPPPNGGTPGATVTQPAGTPTPSGPAGTPTPSGPAGTPTPEPTPPGPGGTRRKVRLAAKPTATRKALRDGLRLRVVVPSGGRVTVQLLAKSRKLTSGATTATKTGTVQVRLAKLSRRQATRALRAAQARRLVLRVALPGATTAFVVLKVKR